MKTKQNKLLAVKTKSLFRFERTNNPGPFLADPTTITISTNTTRCTWINQMNAAQAANDDPTTITISTNTTRCTWINVLNIAQTAPYYPL